MYTYDEILVKIESGEIFLNEKNKGWCYLVSHPFKYPIPIESHVWQRVIRELKINELLDNDTKI